MSLSQHIFDDTPARFFAVLTWRHGRLYIDALDRIEEMQRHRHGVGLSRTELLEVCQDIIRTNSETEKSSQQLELPLQESDKMTGSTEEETSENEKEEANLTAPEMLRQMLHCHWLEEPKRSDYQRVYYLDNRAELLLESLRRMAYPEQVTFTDKLHLVCSRLMDAEAFQEHPLSDFESCNDNLRYGLQELRSLQQGMARLTQRQLRSDSLKENLQVLYDDFSENIGQRCYKQLISLDLPVRLPLIKEHVTAIEQNPVIIAKMEVDLQKRRPELSEDEIATRVSDLIRDTISMLESVEPQSEAVDRRAADFARRSFARFRYLQEVSSGRRSEMRTVFDRVNERYAGAKMAHLPDALELPALKIPSVGLLSGLESLFVPRTPRKKYQRQSLADLYDDDILDDHGHAVDEMQENINSSLNTIRANRFYQTLSVPAAGLQSDAIVTDSEEWLLELAGLLLHGDTLESQYSIYSPREDYEEPTRSEKDGYLIDQFSIHPKNTPS